MGPSRVPKLVIVDDEPDILFLMTLTLRAAGYEVTSTDLASAALEEIRRSMPDLLITDLMMPAMSGRQLVERVRRLPDGPSLPILVVTAGGSDPPTGAEILRKPFGPTDLLTKVAQLLGCSQARL